MKIVITGGHHSSALPVIAELRKEIPEVQIYWFGHRYSQKGNKSDTLEYREITSLNIPFYDLKAGKFYRTIDLIRILKIPFGFFQALILLIKIKPDVILSFGGYLAVPTVIAGWLLGIPSLTHEQTVVAGYANKLVSLFVKKVLISWPKSREYFDDKKIIVTGLPLRDSIYKVNTNSFNVGNDLPYIYFTAGKTGSHLINETVGSCLSELLMFCNVIHQCGEHSEFDDYKKLLDQYNNLKDTVKCKYFPRKYIFEDEIGEAFSKASIVVSRSGAHTIAEIISLKKPAILIPIPWVSHNEQEKNAEYVKKSGLCEVLHEKELSPGVLTNTIKDMINSLDKYELSKDFKDEFDGKNAAKLIVSEVIKIA